MLTAYIHTLCVREFIYIISYKTGKNVKKKFQNCALPYIYICMLSGEQHVRAPFV